MTIPNIIAKDKKLQEMIDKDINVNIKDTWVYPRRNPINEKDSMWYIKLVSITGLVKCTNTYKTEAEAWKGYDKLIKNVTRIKNKH